MKQGEAPMPPHSVHGNHRAAQFPIPFHTTEGHAMELTDPVAPSRDLNGSVLCIEDDPVARELVEALMAAFPGIRLRLADDGRSGIRAALDAMPDVILLDMHLPDMGGVEVVRALNQHIAEGECQVILLTGDTLNIDVVKAMSLGAREYWLKPLSLDRLQSDLPRILHNLHAEREDASEHCMRPTSRWISTSNAPAMSVDH